MGKAAEDEAAKKVAEENAKKASEEEATKKAADEAAQKAADEDAAKKDAARNALKNAWAAEDYAALREGIAMGEAAGLPESEMEHMRAAIIEEEQRQAVAAEHAAHEAELQRHAEEEAAALKEAEEAEPGSPAHRAASEKIDRTKEKRRSSQANLAEDAAKLQEMQQQEEF